MSTTTEFTSKWIQALTLSAGFPAATKIKPTFNDIDAISASEIQPDSEAAAERIWEYVSTRGLQSIAEVAPYQGSDWQFEDEENFRFEKRETSTIGTKEDWIDGMGIRACRVPLTASVTYDDWTNTIRNAALKKGESMNVNSIPSNVVSAGRLLKVPCVGEWDTRHWTIRFEQPDWLTLECPSIFITPRPEVSDIRSTIDAAVRFAESKWGAIKFPNAPRLGSPQPWMQSIDRLKEFQSQVLCDDDLKLSPAIRKAWSCVWPVVYREQNRLKGSCDIQWIRMELESCFRSASELTTWMFIFARLTCMTQVGHGLGISGDFATD